MDENFIEDHKKIEIPLSKPKVFFLLLIGIAFVAGGLVFIFHPEQFQGKGYRDRPIWEVLLIGYACVIFFGVGVIIMLIQLFNKSPGLIIDNNGITINPGLFSTTFIKWNIIEKFSVVSISRSELLLIHLKDPEEYISQQNNAIKRKLASFNLKNYGAPLSIPANSLKCSTNDLLTILTEKLKESEIELPKSNKPV